MIRAGLSVRSTRPETAATIDQIRVTALLELAGDESDLLVLGVAADQVQNIVSIAVEGLVSDGTTITLAMPRAPADLAQTSAGLSVPLIRPEIAATLYQIRVAITFRNPGSTLRLRHVVLYPAAPEPAAPK